MHYRDNGISVALTAQRNMRGDGWKGEKGHEVRDEVDELQLFETISPIGSTMVRMTLSHFVIFESF